MFPTLWDVYGDLFDNNDGLKTLIELINTRKLTHFTSCLKSYRTILPHLKNCSCLRSITVFVGTISICQKAMAARPVAWTRQPTSLCPKRRRSHFSEMVEQCDIASACWKHSFSLSVPSSWPTWFHNFICRCWWSKRKRQSASTTNLYFCILNGLREIFWSWCKNGLLLAHF